MNAYHDIDGIPCASDKWLLTDVLRGEWSFDGTVVSDYYSVELLRSEHGVAADEAGVDVELPYTDCYGDHLVEAVETGELAEETLDTAVRRVLRAKVETGVLDDPTVDPNEAAAPFNTEEASEFTARAACESMTLLQNKSDLLSLAGEDTDSVAVLGPKANDPQELMGDYAYPAHYSEEEIDFEATTPLDAVRERGDALGFDVHYERGCRCGRRRGRGARVRRRPVRRRLLRVRPRPRQQAKRRTSGEGCDVVDLGFPGVQQALVERVHETDTPVVVVVVSGKPHSIEELAEQVSAVVQAWLPGERDGDGIADVLFGEYNSVDHLPVSILRDVGQLPVHYNQKPNTANEDYVYTGSEPLFPFDHGLSYTDFEYRDLTLSTEELPPAGTITAAVTVENTGDCAGGDVVQLYASAENPDQARPVQELVGFERVSLDAGEVKRVSFTVDATQLAYHDRDFDLAVEAGPYEFRVGHSAADVAVTTAFGVTGTKEVPQSGRTYFTETSVTDAE